MTIELPDEAATQRLGEDIAAVIRAGDVLALQGDLGSGKSTLARALIRALADEPDLDVPSPTFTLVQTYGTTPAIAHFDLYRLGHPEELGELGLGEDAQEGAALVEWPERAEGTLPPGTVTLSLSEYGEGRIAALSGEGSFRDRIERSLLARRFLDASGWERATRRRLTADASARTYDVVRKAGREPVLLMNSLPLVLGPVIRDGKAYAEIAHSSRTVHAFVAVDEALAQAGIRVPEIVAQDVANGFLLLEILGSEGILDADGQPIPERYEAAGALLAKIHERDWSPEIHAKAGFTYTIPPYDRDALLIETELLLDWFIPWRDGKPASAELRAAFKAEWNRLITRLEATEQSLVLRDHQSPNTFWLADRQGSDRIALIDFQDALIGPAAYDVASIATDPRVTISEELEAQVVAAYEKARNGSPRFDPESFREACAICAAQRHTKILGIFVRLKLRDGKDGYIAHLPRIRDYLRRALRHPALTDLRALYQREGILS
ncbi:tRNA (adenosine(37)-N6)-threonylcarbamoyltransferase complex ATPase subunit type 1 TsaE [Mesorhizobium sp. RP14(2022)]|uniref:tRNA threonylcarbamoyladenosine biosynthesis protein TsaE n=1 Tax=Mesorhizobium liriopis TaxID=2953882 RepID=A0ABT1C2P4_9HYPH|nr:tRNA (adenosine(37)-N6)-threonylcarbamoyltransferase complex ATPase subunit type 1 TsaE [Mesorhizobium liriopis]